MLMTARSRTGHASSRLLGSRWTLAAIVGIGLLLRIALMLALPQAPMSDGEFYMLRAAEMARGLGYQEGGHPTAFWPVGYPALLAGSMLVAGSGLLGPMLLNLLAAGATIVLVHWFARRAGAGEGAALLGALLYALYPAHIAYAGTTTAETVAAAVIMLAFALLLGGRGDRRLLVLSGVAWGAATLVRTQSILFPIGAIVAMAILLADFGWRRAVAATLIVYAAAIAVVLPWSLRNERMLGAFVFVSTNGGVALYTGANDFATGDHMALEKTPLWNASGIPFADRIERQVETDARFRALAGEWIAADPARWLRLGFRKMALLWRKDSDGFWFLKGSYPAAERALTLAQWANQLFYMALMAGAACCLAAGTLGLLRRDERARRLLLLALMPIFVTLTAFVFTGQVRYHHQAMPFVAAAAGWALHRLHKGWRAARGRR